jgi:flagellar FliJ protein
MQARTRKLAPVVEHVDKHEKSALEAMAYSQKQLNMQQEILQQLQRYKEEYTHCPTEQQPVSYSCVQLQEYNRFLAQLDQTIKQQQGIVEMAMHEVEVKRSKWKYQRSRSQAMHHVVDRIEASEQQQLQKADQKLMDEFALRQRLRDH